MVQCFICRWASDKAPRRSFHRFPADEKQRKKWLEILGKSNVELSYSSRATICSLHFEKNCFRYGAVMGRTLLKEGSLPSLYLTKTSADLFLQKEKNECSTIGSDFCDSSFSAPINEKCSAEKIVIKRHNKQIKHEISKKHLEISPLKKSAAYNLIESNQLQHIKEKLNMKNKKISSLERVIRRLHQSKSKMEDHIKQLQSENTKHIAEKEMMHAFRERTKRDARDELQHELEKLEASAREDRRAMIGRQFAGFRHLFERFLQEEGPSLEWDHIQKLPEDAVKDYNSLPSPETNEVKELLDKLVVVKLNGGLGTSMGCHGPKSVIAVRNCLTFLDLTVQQIEHLNKTYNANVPLILMNSFNTDDDTQRIIRKYKGIDIDIYTFNQSCYPRINRDSLLPIAKHCQIDEDIEAWYPPGHGDFYESFQNSGLLKKFIREGREYCFISNIDNLGATVDIKILRSLLSKKSESPLEFVMEVTDKTRADVKGGTLIKYDDKLRLLEIAQVPKDHIDDFKSIKTFKYFNTNNLWIKLSAIERVLEQKALNMEIIVNNKTFSNGLNIIQLETAVGAAMKSFEGSIGINVPRSRFLPVKKTSDLMLVMSNLYTLRNGSLVMSPQRMFPTTPLIKLGDNHFSKVKEFLTRFPTIPDLLELDHLTVSGDVTFGKGVTLKGTVIIIANHGERIDLPSGTVLENKIVSGNLRILDH